MHSNMVSGHVLLGVIALGVQVAMVACMGCTCSRGDVGEYQWMGVTCASLQVLMLCSVFSDTDLVVTTLVMLCTCSAVLVGGGVLLVCGCRFFFFYGHLYVGRGLPHVLRIALCIIEHVSSWFRIVSLALRLHSNMVSGHVLLGVIALGVQVATSMTYALSGVFVVVLVVFVGMKVLTCVIQGVVLDRLLTIYWSEWSL
nr:ATP synthase F0 subunit a [Artemidia motanka]